jgi:hypothetical protein
MTLRKLEDTGNCKRKHCIALCGELVLEEAMNLSLERLSDDDDDDDDDDDERLHRHPARKNITTNFKM